MMTNKPTTSLSSALCALPTRLVALVLFCLAAFSATGDQRAILPASVPGGDNTIASVNAGAKEVIGTSADNDTFRLHAADVFDVRGFVADIANDKGDAFAAFRRNAQLRLFSALEDELSRRGEDALLSNFSAVRRADIFVQTALGGRNEQLGFQVIGAFAELPNHSAFGWQLRAFGGTNDYRGANVGIFFRRLQGDYLYGGSFFGDYEDSEHGGFFRYGAGVELQNRHFTAAANYYLPLKDEHTFGPTVMAFSRQGYDANLRVAVPGARFLDAEAAYYYYEGKTGTPADKGFRYGAALSPGYGFKLKVFYDNSGEEVGGEVSYAHTIGGNEAQTSGGGGEFAPDLFAPVWREYSQRIGLVTTTISPPSFEVMARHAQVNINRLMAVVNIPNHYYARSLTVSVLSASSPPQRDISLSGVPPRISVYYNPLAAVSGEVTIAVQGIRGDRFSATSFVMTVNAYSAAFAAGFALLPTLNHTISTQSTIGTILPREGATPYRYESSHEDVVINNDDGLVLFDATGSEPYTTEVRLTANDSDPVTPPVLIVITLSVSAASP